MTQNSQSNSSTNIDAANPGLLITGCVITGLMMLGIVTGGVAWTQKV